MNRIYQFNLLFLSFFLSRYESDEDEIILDYIQKYKPDDNASDRKFADLALILDRTRASVWRRHRILKRRLETRDEDTDKNSEMVINF